MVCLKQLADPQLRIENVLPLSRFLVSLQDVGSEDAFLLAVEGQWSVFCSWPHRAGFTRHPQISIGLLSPQLRSATWKPRLKPLWRMPSATLISALFAWAWLGFAGTSRP